MAGDDLATPSSADQFLQLLARGVLAVEDIAISLRDLVALLNVERDERRTRQAARRRR